MIEQQVGAVFARSAAFREGDQSPALAAEALDEARELWDAAQSGSSELAVPFYVVASIAVLHWCRYGAMPEGRDHNDLQVAAVMYSHVLTVDPDPVPEDLKVEIANAGVQSFEDDFGIPAWFHGSYVARQYPSSNSPHLANGPTWWARRAEVILLQPDLDNDPSLQGEAISLLRRAAQAAPAPLSDPAEHLHGLGRALFARFQQFSTEEANTDLDEAIESLRLAVQRAPSGHAHRKVFMNSLGRAVALRFDRTGRQPDYDEAISIMAALRHEEQSGPS
jgi:tetratricopeptide (TPR) repeat protein